MQKWFEKFIASHAKETFNLGLVEDVYNTWNQHDNELNEVWHLTNSQVRLDIAEAFRKEMESEWSREFSELMSKQVISVLEENWRTAIKAAYAGGYMMGKGWISMEQLADFNLYLGDKLAQDIRETLKRSKSRGIAFASGFSAVSVQGHLTAMGR